MIQSQCIVEANKGNATFGDTELQSHDLGCFVHIEHKTDTGTSREHLMLLRPSSKGRVVDLHRRRNSSWDKWHLENIQHIHKLNMEQKVDALEMMKNHDKVVPLSIHVLL